MRESNRATLVLKASKPVYNTETGKMDKGTAQEVVVPCFVSDMGLQLKNQLLNNKLNVGAKVMRVNKPVSGSVESVKVDGKTFYIINRKSFYKRREAIYLSEVNHE
nr:hypothetical protein [Streptococcus lutetiensis]